MDWRPGDQPFSFFLGGNNQHCADRPGRLGLGSPYGLVHQNYLSPSGAMTVNCESASGGSSSAQIISIGRPLPRHSRHGCPLPGLRQSPYLPGRQAIPVTGEGTFLLYGLLTIEIPDVNKPLFLETLCRLAIWKGEHQRSQPKAVCELRV